MKTTTFLLNYLDNNAIVTINNTQGSILYEGLLGDLPISIVRETTVNRIEGLGSNNDIIIEIERR